MKSFLLNFLAKYNFFRPFIKFQPEIEKNFFFVLGSGRNGSTLLSIILNNHQSVFLPKEQYALPYVIAKYYLTFYSSYAQKFKFIFRDFENHSQDWQLSSALKKNIINQFLNDRKHPKCFQLMYYHIVKNLSLVNTKNAILFGDHTPLLIRNMDIVRQSFKGSKYILLVRDPRDVVASYMKMGHPVQDTPVKVAQRWNEGINNFLNSAQKKDFIHIVVRYEDLVSNAESTIHTICTFLEIEFQEGMLDTVSKDNKLKEFNLKLKHHQNLKQPISNKSIGKWKSELSEDAVKNIKDVVLDNAKRFGYTFE